MYFRVSRQSTGFDWEIFKQAGTSVSFNAIPATANVVLENKTAKITWDPNPLGFIPGASFVITRINNTAKTQSEIKLAKADFDKGSYTDNLVTNCNNYSYTLQVIPPVGSSFPTPAATAVAGNVMPVDIGSLNNLIASKGYFPDRTELRWTANGEIDNFIIKRALYGSNNFVQIAQVPGSSTGEYQYDDAKGSPGTYYTYQVQGIVSCNGTVIPSAETLQSIGFRSPTGNIYGRITYENGQSVEDVGVRLQSNDVAQLGKSVYLNGRADSYLKLDNTNTPFADSAFTVEGWIKPDAAAPIDQVIFSGIINIRLASMDRENFSLPAMEAAPQVRIATQTTLGCMWQAYAQTTLFLFCLNEAIIGRAAVPYSASSQNNTVYIGRSASGQWYKGYIDEMRLYNKAVDMAQVIKNGTRLFAGDEEGLTAYWRFGQTILNQFYDLSYHGENYNRNDGTMSSTAIIRSANIPTSDQLALKAFTDLSGNYLIKGIPYVGNGTTYTVVPLKGTHQFDPISVNRLISPSSSQFTVDFKDKSSFPFLVLYIIATPQYRYGGFFPY